MNDRTTQSPALDATTPAVDAATPDTTPARRRVRLPAQGRRPAFFLAAAAAGAIVVNVLATGAPDAEATATPTESVSVAEQLGITADTAAAATPDAADLAPLQELAASRSEREAAAASAAQAQAAADQAELDRQAAEREAAERAAAEAAAAEQAAREAAEREAAERQAAAAAAAAAPAAAPAPSSGGSAAPRGSFKEYAMSKVGSAQQFSCLENLWGKESGWNPNAQNPTSTAYGIPQFLNSTWAGTGIAKTSDGYRQIDAGLIYIENRYGSPCGAWAHSQANNWY
ncbi:aggregation-promoting factor C-terminal-like domain-containing protein [Geodermatophilus sp. SYSU D00079]